MQAYKGSVCVCKENLCFVTLYGLLEKAGPQMQSLFSSEHKDASTSVPIGAQKEQKVEQEDYGFAGLDQHWAN